MTEIRCVKCNRLLFKGTNFYGSIEVKCPKCGYINNIFEEAIKDSLRKGEIGILTNFSK